MRKVVLLLLVALVAMALVGCGKKVAPATEEPVAQTINPADTATPPPPPPPPAEARSIVDGMFKTVYFDFDKADLRNDGRAALDANYALLNEFQSAVVEIQGHCDERGTIEYNLALGERRAKAAQSYLVGLGVPANRLQTVSFGEERPAVPGHDESAWSKNRRAEFRVVSQ